MKPTVTRIRRVEGGYRDHLTDSGFFVREAPRGRDRFQVMERGAGPRGGARKRDRFHSLDDALAALAEMKPSTPQEILAHVPVNSFTKDHLAELFRLGQRGVRLLIKPMYGDDGFGGRPWRLAVSEGIAVSRLEAFFGAEPHCWLVRWRCDDDETGLGHPLALEEARRAWWVLDANDDTVAGGPPISRDRADELAQKYGGRVVSGEEFIKMQTDRTKETP